MKRFLATFIAVALLVTIIPGVASAARPFRQEVNRIIVGCNPNLDDGTFVSAVIIHDHLFGDSAGVAVVPPDSGVPSLSGVTDTIMFSEGAEVVLSATVPLVDENGVAAGEAEIVMTVAPVGEPFVDEGDNTGNLNSHTHVVIQSLEGAGTISLPGEADMDATCFGDDSEGAYFQTQPWRSSFTSHWEAFFLDCEWSTDDGFFSLFGRVNTQFGTNLVADFLGAGTDAPFSGTFDESGVDASLHLSNVDTGDEYTATVEASFTPDGDPLKWVVLGNVNRRREVQQLMSVDGTFALSTGDVFTMDDEACRARILKVYDVFTAPAGPKTGKAQANDTPDGAIALVPGAKFNVQTTGTAEDAEVPNVKCRVGTDLMGYTLWFTVVGTGGVMRFDTTGSNFDTLVAVYVMDGDELVEILCQDNQQHIDEAISLQADVELETEEGLTYWIQVGGPILDREFGRLHVEVSG